MSSTLSKATGQGTLSDQRGVKPETAEIAGQAGIIAAGSVAGRILGLGREVVKSHYFGAGGQADALTIAIRAPVLLYDLFIGGMISSALVPVMVKYKQDGRLWELLSILLTLGALIFSLFTLLLMLFAPQIASFMSGGSPAPVLAQTSSLLRLTAPAAMFLGLSGIFMSALYALKRFLFPAFAAAMLNAGMVLLTVLLQGRLGAASMAWGLLFGALLQLALQWASLRDAPLRLRMAVRHPAVGRISRLYAPIFLGLLVEGLISRPLTYRLASLSGSGGISRLEYAQIIGSFPRGLVALGISTAVLPLLSAHAARERLGHRPSRAAFRETLARGSRLILALIIPASLGLLLLARPVIALILQHGSFNAQDSLVTARALQLTLLSLPLAAMDGLIVYAFYARQKTLAPALTGVAAVGLYLLLAYNMQQVWGLYGIIIAEGLKLLAHLSLLLALLSRELGGIGGNGLARLLWQTSLASGLMGVAILATLRLLPAPAGSLLSELAHVLLPGLAGLAAYLFAAKILAIDEVTMIGSAIIKRFKGTAAHE